MRSLLDVNMLIALLDENHVRHTDAAVWLDDHVAGGWASCPPLGAVGAGDAGSWTGCRLLQRMGERLRR